MPTTTLTRSEALRLITPFVQILDQNRQATDTHAALLHSGAYRMVQLFVIQLNQQGNFSTRDVVKSVLCEYRDRRSEILSAQDLARSLNLLCETADFGSYHAVKGFSDLMHQVLANKVQAPMGFCKELASNLRVQAIEWLSDKPKMTVQAQLNEMDPDVVARYGRELRQRSVEQSNTM